MAVADPRVLLRMPGCGGCHYFYFGVCSYLQRHVDLARLAFVTHSGSGFAVATLLTPGLEVADVCHAWIQRSQAFMAAGAGLYALPQLITAHIADYQADPRRFPTVHHVATTTVAGLQTRWTSDFRSVADYTEALLASMYIPGVIGPRPWTTLRGERCFDGAIGLRRRPILGHVQYRASFHVPFDGKTSFDSVVGIYMPDDHVDVAMAQFQAGYAYAQGPLAAQLATCGVASATVPLYAPAPTPRTIGWCRRTQSFRGPARGDRYRGPWWYRVARL